MATGCDCVRGQFTLFTWRSPAFRRIDDHLAKPALAAKAREATIYKGEKFSDHAPLTIEDDFKL